MQWHKLLKILIIMIIFTAIAVAWTSQNTTTLKIILIIFTECAGSDEECTALGRSILFLCYWQPCTGAIPRRKRICATDVRRSQPATWCIWTTQRGESNKGRGRRGLVYEHVTNVFIFETSSLLFSIPIWELILLFSLDYLVQIYTDYSFVIQDILFLGCCRYQYHLSTDTIFTFNFLLCILGNCTAICLQVILFRASGSLFLRRVSSTRRFVTGAEMLCVTLASKCESNHLHVMMKSQPTNTTFNQRTIEDGKPRWLGGL